ncbi:DUF3322 domain-containing protein [Endozoicomonas sp. 2B-B]
MISQKELKKKALRPWVSGTFLKSWLNDEVFFPFEVPFKTPSGRTLSSEFIQVRDWVAELHRHSRAVTGSGYQLEYRTISHQQLGQQRLPHKILFESRDDWLTFIGQQSAFKQFQALANQTRRQLPQVMPLVNSKPVKLLDYADVWPQLIKVCRYFQLNPQPYRYIRQLDIQGVDTKFIESHKGVLSDLLMLALEPGEFDDSVSGIAENGFERRFGLCYDEPLIRFRLLDSAAPATDMSVPLSQFVDPGVSRVFITENKINGLTFPSVKDAIVIFGLGYGIRSLFSLNWLEDKQISYWGDIDTHGFSILSQLRGRFRQTESLLMDQATLDMHMPLCVEEPESKRFLAELTNLTNREQVLFDALRQNKLSKNLRLEQERIAFSCLREALAAGAC